ncbi:MAG: hypothetical protein ACI4XA_08145, partial [Oscillospiraceae bacterium]
MSSKHKAYRGYIKSYLGIFGAIILATLVIVSSTLVFGYTAKKASDETTISLGRCYLEEMADRNVYEMS